MRKRHETASQTAGPYVHIGCMPNFAGITGVYPDDPGARICGDTTEGTRITVCGVIHDGTGRPLGDALVEVWQANAEGRYGTDATGFTGWGRQAADADTGLWQFETIKPGAVPHASGALMAPHLTLWIVARGINTGLHTRMYFPEDTAAHATDPVLARIEHRDRLPTLIAKSDGNLMYHFSIYLQGPDETVFFDV